MGCDLLIDSMKVIQQKYLELLKRYEDFEPQDTYFIQNEFKIFWLRHKREIAFFVQNYPCDFDTCVFIGGAYLSVESNAFFPFLAFGKKHIVDDPIYLLSLGAQDSDEYHAQILKESIKDDILVLSKYSDLFFLLPLSFLCIDRTLCANFSQNSFLHLLKNDKASLRDFFESCTTWESLLSWINEDVANDLFIEYDGETLEERYFRHLEKVHIAFDKDNAVRQFFQMCMGIFTQVAVVFDFCTHYAVYPFIRNRTLFYSFFEVVSNLIYQESDSAFLKRMIFKAILSHSTNCLLDWETSNLAKEDFYQKITGFEDAIMSCFASDVFDPYSGEYSIAKIRDILIEEIKKRGLPCTMC